MVNSLIDLPFALPTIVAGLTLLALYGPRSPVGVDVAYTRAAVVLALLFVTLPVRRARRAAGAARARPRDGAGGRLARREPAAPIFRRIILPNLTPAILAGAGLAFARAIGEFGSLVLITGNLPFKTRGRRPCSSSAMVESDNPVGGVGRVGGAARDLAAWCCWCFGSPARQLGR